MKLYKVTIEPMYLEAEDEEDAVNQALSMLEEGAWELSLTEQETGA